MSWLTLRTGRKINLSLQTIFMELTNLEEALFLLALLQEQSCLESK